MTKKFIKFSLFMALMVFATTHVGSAWAEVPSVVSLGDINGNGKPEVSVLLRGADSYARLKNYAYVMDASEGALINSVLFGDGGTIPTPVSQAVVPDFDDGSGGGPNGVDEIAMLGVRPDDGAVVVLINDASTGAWIKTLGFDADFPPVAMAVVPDMDGNGISEIAVLGVNSTNGKVRVAIKDASTNGWIPSLTFDANYPPIAMKVVKYASGAVGIAVLGVNPVDGNVKVVVRDVSTRSKIGDAIHFYKDFSPVDMAVVPDMDGNSEPEIAVLGVNSTDGRVKVTIKDASSGVRVNAVFFDSDFSPIEMAVLPDVNSSGFPEIAVLGARASDGAVRALVKDASNSSWISSLGFGRHYASFGMTVLPDMNGNGAEEIAILVVDASTGRLEVVIKDASSDALVNNIAIPFRMEVCDNNVPQMDINSTVDVIIEASGDYSYFRIEVPSSGLLALYTTGDMDTYGYLKDSNCNTIAGNDDSGEGYNFRISYSVDAGAYYVDVRSGTGSYTLNVELVVPTPFTGVTAIAAGRYHRIALKSDGTVWAWGYNGQGQLGAETTETCGYHAYPCSTTPLQVNGLTGVTAIAAGTGTYGSQSIALKSDGTVWAWGYNGQGQLGNGTTTDSSVPVQVCAGGETAPCSSFLTGVTAITAGELHSIALKADGTVRAWGDNYFGQLGDGTTTSTSVPVQVCAGGETAPCSSFLTDVAAVAVAIGWHNMALKTDGTVLAWGRNGSGQLGNGTTTETCGPSSTPCKTTPVQVNGLTDVVGIAGGDYHSMAVKTDGTVWAWGYNGQGQLGDGTNTTSYVPLQVCAEGETAPCSNFLSGVTTISAGYYHNMALKTDGTVWAWGNNFFGQLGDGTTTDSSVPLQVCAEGETAPCSNFLTDVAGIAGGRHHSIAVKTDGTAWAWGYNGYGQLGNGTTADSYTPVQVIDNPWLP